jgi:DNA repair protein RecO (recombination protein O)
MLQKINGIVLRSTLYAESSHIIQIYTKQFGLQSYIISSGKSKKSKGNRALLQALSLVEFVAMYSEQKKIHRIIELTIEYPFSNLHFVITKNLVAVFLNEVLTKALKESHTDEDLYNFLKNSFIILDLHHHSIHFFHLVFMLKLSKYLGFSPQQNFSESNSIFDLKEGKFINHLPNHPHYIDAKDSRDFSFLLTINYENINTIASNSTTRKILLLKIIEYYRLHISTFNELKSLTVLEEIIA